MVVYNDFVKGSNNLVFAYIIGTAILNNDSQNGQTSKKNTT